MAGEWQTREPLPDKSDRVLSGLNGRWREIPQNRIAPVASALNTAQSLQIDDHTAVYPPSTIRCAAVT